MIHDSDAKVDELPLALQTVYAELIDQCASASFARDFPAKGAFIVRERNGRRYWYFQTTTDTPRRQRYVGPESPDLLRRIAAHRGIQAEARVRGEMVRTLRRARMPHPDAFVGDVLAALSSAGVFRLRTVLIGTIAYQVYAPLLGVRLPAQHLRTGDIDLAQFRDVSILVDDETPPIIEVLRKVDPTFRPVPHATDSSKMAVYQSAKQYRVEFLTPNRGPDADAPRRLPALGTDAQPMRFLDFLIRDYLPAVALHDDGVLVNVPAPERFALQKLIVARRRRERAAKIDKDVRQAASLLNVLAAKRQPDLRSAAHEIKGRGPKWRQLLAEGLSMLPAETCAVTLAAIGDVLTLATADRPA